MSNRLAQRLAAVPPGTLYAGIDLSLDRLAVELLDAAGRRLDHFEADNSPDGYAYLRQRLQRAVEKQQATGVWVGMEPTNYCWKQLGYDLEQPALPFRLVNALTDTRRPPVSFIAALSYGFRFGVGDLETDVCVGTGGGETL